MSSHVTVLRGILSEGTVSFHAVFAKAFKSIPVGVFLSQSFFWQENRKYKSEKIHLEIDGKQFFTKTAKDWFDETGLTTDQQQKVRSILCTASVLEERLVGNPAKMFYHIDFEALVSVINQYLVSGVSASADRRGGNVFKEQTKRGKAKNRVGNKPILSLGLNPKLESDLNPSLESDLNPNYPILESLDSFESEGERTPPAPNPSNLQSPKKESGLVAPGRADCDGSYGVGKIEFYPAAAEDEDAFAQWLPSLHTAMENNAPGAMPMPTHIVTETTDDPNIRITTGVNLSEPVTKTITFPQNTPRPLRYDEYPNPRNANELKDRLKEYFTHHPEDWRLLIENAKVNWMPEKLEETTLAYCLYQEKEGNMKRTYNTYKAGLTTWFMRQKSWDAQNNAPKEGGQTRQNGQPHSALPRSLQNQVGK